MGAHYSTALLGHKQYTKDKSTDCEICRKKTKSKKDACAVTVHAVHIFTQCRRWRRPTSSQAPRPP